MPYLPLRKAFSLENDILEILPSLLWNISVEMATRRFLIRRGERAKITAGTSTTSARVSPTPWTIEVGLKFEPWEGRFGRKAKNRSLREGSLLPISFLIIIRGVKSPAGAGSRFA